MNAITNNALLTDYVVDRLNVGIFMVNQKMEITLWNKFMASHSGLAAETLIGRNLFECFPELPKTWLSKKIEGVFLLNNSAFTSWEQRPYLFRFQHNRPITGALECMYQNFTFMPVKDEMGQVNSVCITLTDATDIAISQTSLSKAIESLSESSYRDGLTGIYNRRYLEQRLSTEFDRCKRYKGLFSFIMFDLDHFKRVNDTYGHLAGDEVLCVVSQRITSLLRTVDVMGRYGGEEFCIILPSTPMEGTLILAERIRQIISQEPIMYKGSAIALTVSIGAVSYDPEMSKYERLIHCADLALYFGKKNGRNRVTSYTPELEAKE